MTTVKKKEENMKYEEKILKRVGNALSWLGMQDDEEKNIISHITDNKPILS